MINLQPCIDRIKANLDQDTEASVTYAALEARLTLERVCYDRLRQRHDYISHAQLSKWQPSAVINKLMEEVDPFVGETVILSISTSPADNQIKPEDQDYVQLGTEIGVKPKRIGKLWNALSRLALHAHLPQHKDDQLPEYGDKVETRKKVYEVLVELEKLSKSTMSFSGAPMGAEVTFACVCGEKNRRRANLLKNGQYVHCINPDCKVTWKAVQGGENFDFETVTVPVRCESCRKANHMAWRFFMDMKHDEYGTFSCHSCHHKNFVQWRLMRVRPAKKRGSRKNATSAPSNTNPQ